MNETNANIAVRYKLPEAFLKNCRRFYFYLYYPQIQSYLLGKCVTLPHKSEKSPMLSDELIEKSQTLSDKSLSIFPMPSEKFV